MTVSVDTILGDHVVFFPERSQINQIKSNNKYFIVCLKTIHFKTENCLQTHPLINYTFRITQAACLGN